MLQRMRIGTMLYLGFGLVIALIFVIVATTHWRVQRISGIIDAIGQDIYPGTTAAAAIRFSVTKNWANTLTLNTTNDKDAAQKITEEMAINSKVITEKFEVLKKMLSSDSGKQLLAVALAAREDYTSKRKNYLALLKEDQKDAAGILLVGDLKLSLENYIGSINKIFISLSTELEEKTENSMQIAGNTRSINLISGLVALAIAIAASMAIVRTLLVQLGGEVHAASAVARSIAEGDLAVDIPVRSGDSSSLLASLLAMRDKLRGITADIQHGAQRVSDTARRVSQAAAEVAQASARQSDSTGSAAAAVEQLTVSIDHLSHNAEDAHTYSRQASEVSQSGEQVIRDAGTEMEKIALSVESSSGIIAELEQRSNEISVVVKVISDIADQTNLLALNAAIEAARAGEQGRGFAVVADEVRKLAERTAASTKEIAATIEKIQRCTEAALQSMVSGVEQVKSGTRMAEQAGQSIGEIQTGAARVVEAINDISAALKEQGTASNHISQSIERIAQMVSANNAASEDVANAARDMEQLSDGLSTAVKFFRA